MNILEVNEELKEFYIADNDVLKIFSLEYNLEANLIHTFRMPAAHQVLSHINYIKRSKMGEEDLLILLTHSGVIFIYYPQN